jgi:hypothetical protein
MEDNGGVGDWEKYQSCKCAIKIIKNIPLDLL